MFCIFIFLFRFFVFVFEICAHFLSFIDVVYKTVDMIYFFNRCSKSIFLFSNGADGYKLSVFASIYMVKIKQI